MPADFPVIHDAALALVDELDRVLDRDDVVLTGKVRLVDDGRKRGRLAASRWPGDQDQAPGERGQLGDDLGKAQFGAGDDLAGDLPKHRPAAELLLEEIGAVTGNSRDLIGKIDIARLFELLDLVFRGDFVDHRLQAVVRKDVELDPLQVSPETERRLLAGDEVQVGCPLVVHQLEERIDFCHG